MVFLPVPLKPPSRSRLPAKISSRVASLPINLTVSEGSEDLF
jgi:hypothetical protein